MCSFVHIITLFLIRFRLACALSLAPSSLKLQCLESEVEAEVIMQAEKKKDETKVE